MAAFKQGENAYLDLMRRILHDGEPRNGRNGITYGLFGEKLSFDLRCGFPLLTTKRVFWRGVVEELLWFLRGSTDTRELAAKKVHIWDANTTREFLDGAGLHHLPVGELGPGYGFQWRCFNGNYPERVGGVDQLTYVVDRLINEPFGRRALLSAWNPCQISQAALPPCHVLYEFYRGRDGLSCMMVMRSCDVAAGLPFNIASTALLTTIIAAAIGETPGNVVVVAGDTHLYEQHLENARVQVAREPYAPPRLSIAREPPAGDASVADRVKWIESLEYVDFELAAYDCHPALKYEMVA
jgi:thymidylate synthase